MDDDLPSGSALFRVEFGDDQTRARAETLRCGVTGPRCAKLAPAGQPESLGAERGSAYAACEEVPAPADSLREKRKSEGR
jgi:hypothetical protein